MYARVWCIRTILMVQAFSIALHLVSILSKIHLELIAHRCFRPFWRIYFWHALPLNQPADLMNTRPTCHRLPVECKKERFFSISIFYSIKLSFIVTHVELNGRGGGEVEFATVQLSTMRAYSHRIHLLILRDLMLLTGNK